MDLILMPIAVTVFVVGLFMIPLLVGGTMLCGRTSAGLGKRLLTYSSFALSGGVVCCWIGFALMLCAWPLERHRVHFADSVVSLPIAIFWASGPVGVLVGLILAGRFLKAGRGEATDDAHERTAKIAGHDH